MGIGNFWATSICLQFTSPTCRIWYLSIKFFLKIQVSPEHIQLFYWVFVLWSKSGMSFQDLMTYAIISGCLYGFSACDSPSLNSWLFSRSDKNQIYFVDIFLSSFKSFLSLESYFLCPYVSPWITLPLGSLLPLWHILIKTSITLILLLNKYLSIKT